MNYAERKKANAGRRTHRVRSRFAGSSSRPRLSVHISNLHITAQIIDDEKKLTLAYATTVGVKSEPKTMTARASEIGKEIAEMAKLAKVKQVVFDRGSRKYHGRIKALAEAARDNGLEF